MARVELEVVIRAPLETVYAVARDVEAFPQFMPDVKSVRILEKSDDGSRTLTEWVAYASQLKLQVKWTEEDLWDDTARTCRFAGLRTARAAAGRNRAEGRPPPRGAEPERHLGWGQGACGGDSAWRLTAYACCWSRSHRACYL
jgi:hypothetical protein